MADDGGGIDLELGIKKKLPEVVREIFTPEQIDEYKQLFQLYDYNNEGVINISLVPKILTRVQHEYKPLDLQMAIQEIDDSQGPDIDEMIFLQLAAKCYLQSWSKKQILKAFKVLNQPKKGYIANKAMLQYYLCDYGEPFDYIELKLFLSLAEPDLETGDIDLKKLIKKLGKLVPRKHQISRIKKEITVKGPKISEVVKKLSIKKKMQTDAADIVKKSKSLDRLLKTIDMLSDKSGSSDIDTTNWDEVEEDYFTVPEIVDEQQPENAD